MYENLDNSELLRASIDAMGREQSGEAMSLLKILVEREPENFHGHYLLAAEHMQLGMVDRAEEGFRRAVALAPDFPLARFQLGQLYLVKGDAVAAKSTLGPLLDLPPGSALPCYAQGLIAVADEDGAGAIETLRAGLACEQDSLPLASDMQRLLAQLLATQGDGALPVEVGMGAAVNAAPLYLSAYGKADP